MNPNLSGLMADNGYNYPSDIELRNIFASSCVEAVARHLQTSAMDMYRRMKQVELFRDLIYPCYDTLHTQSREIVTEDIIQALTIREQKLKTEMAWKFWGWCGQRPCDWHRGSIYGQFDAFGDGIARIVKASPQQPTVHHQPESDWWMPCICGIL